MTDHLLHKRENYIRKLVSNARAIISNQIAIPLGIHKMIKIISWINQVIPLESIDFKVFVRCDSKTKNFPLGSERLEYQIEYLKQLDKELDELTLEYKDLILEKCFEIVKHFQNQINEKNTNR